MGAFYIDSLGWRYPLGVCASLWVLSRSNAEGSLCLARWCRIQQFSKLHRGGFESSLNWHRGWVSWGLFTSILLEGFTRLPFALHSGLCRGVTLRAPALGTIVLDSRSPKTHRVRFQGAGITRAAFQRASPVGLFRQARKQGCFRPAAQGCANSGDGRGQLDSRSARLDTAHSRL